MGENSSCWLSCSKWHCCFHVEKQGPSSACHNNQGKTHAELDLDPEVVKFSLNLLKGNTTGHFWRVENGLGEEEGIEG